MLEAILRLHPTTFCAPATIYRFLIKEDLSAYDLRFIKHAGVAGEPLNPEVYYKIKELTGLALYEGFGQQRNAGHARKLWLLPCPSRFYGKTEPHLRYQPD